MLDALPHSEATPPLWYVLEWAWVRIFGTTEVGLRSLSALVGTLLIPLSYEVARVFLQRQAPAIAVAAFVAVSPIMVWYSQEARSYELYVFLAASSLLFFGRSLRDPTPGALWLWATCASLAVATHYFAGFIVAGEAVLLLVLLGLRRCGAPIALVVAVAAALAPLAAYQNEHVVSGLTAAGANLGARLKETGIRFAIFFTDPGGTFVLVVAVVVVTLLVWRGRSAPGSRLALLLATSALLLPIILALVGVKDVFNFRNVLAAWVPLVIAAAAGIPATRWGAAVTVAVCVALGAATLAIATRTGLQRDSWRDAADVLRQVPGRRVVIGESGELAYSLRYYWPQLEPLPRSGARVREIDVVGRTSLDSLSGTLSRFRPAAKRDAGNLTVTRFLRRQPARVTPVEISTSGYFGGRLAAG
jgi:hypothetical protein